MSSSFPLPWERVRWRSRRLGVSDFRVVQLRRGTSVAEVALHDISSIHVVPSLIERITGVGTVVVTSTRAGDRGIRVRVAYGADDPIRPNGVKRSNADIVAFMQDEVMPWARAALEPVVGRGQVRCETCHGADAEEKRWRMPAVRALPEPAVRELASAAGSDSQMRNALHGYVAQERSLAIASRMRGVVVPGMAALLRRPAYDFANTYEYNRARDAFGCYHCHIVSSQ